MIEALKYGALTIGLAVLAYTAALLKIEIAKSHPRAEARNLILMYMGFSLFAFGLAVFLELKKDKSATEFQALSSTVRENIATLDTLVDLKSATSVSNLPDSVDTEN